MQCVRGDVIEVQRAGSRRVPLVDVQRLPALEPGRIFDALIPPIVKVALLAGVDRPADFDVQVRQSVHMHPAELPILPRDLDEPREKLAIRLLAHLQPVVIRRVPRREGKHPAHPLRQPRQLAVIEAVGTARIAVRPGQETRVCWNCKRWGLRTG